jgi:NADH:ubiquinone oxidoreductase subunit 2 (subunit N)
MTNLFLKTADLNLPGYLQVEAFLILLALLFKLGSAPVHLYVISLYSSIKRPLLLYMSTAPKVSLFTFWAAAWQLVWTDYTLGVFIVYSLILGSLGAYGLASQPAVRALFAYSTISEIGFMLLATETAGFHTLFQHLSIYVISQFIIWNLSDKRLFALCAISLAGIPPLAGFFGKAWIFFHAVNLHMISLLLIALACSVFSIIYYVRLLRLFWNLPTGQTLSSLMYQTTGFRAIGLTSNSYHNNTNIIARFGASPKGSGTSDLPSGQVGFTSACLIALIYLPVFLVKPFVL